MAKTKTLNTPVLLIVYNRAELTRRVITTLQEVKPRKLYVAADGPKDSEEDKQKCEDVRELFVHLSWKCNVFRLFQKKNIGCKFGPITGINWLFTKEKQGIILEDDIVPDPTFFRYSEELLGRYKNDISVGCISGGNVIASEISTDSSYYFSRYSQTYGWATWRRAWRTYDKDIRGWLSLKKKHLLSDLFSNPLTRWYWSIIFDQVYRGDIPSAWDYQWTYSSWINSLLTVMPRVNMVQNIGFGENDATHTKRKSWISNIPVESMKFPLIHPKEKSINSKADELLQKRHYVLWKELFMAGKRKLDSYLNRLR